MRESRNRRTKRLGSNKTESTIHRCDCKKQKNKERPGSNKTESTTDRCDCKKLPSLHDFSIAPCRLGSKDRTLIVFFPSVIFHWNTFDFFCLAWRQFCYNTMHFSIVQSGHYIWYINIDFFNFPFSHQVCKLLILSTYLGKSYYLYTLDWNLNYSHFSKQLCTCKQKKCD